jgi:hypothetical protein
METMYISFQTGSVEWPVQDCDIWEKALSRALQIILYIDARE